MTLVELSGLQVGDIVSHPPDSYQVVKKDELRGVFTIARVDKPGRGYRCEINANSLFSMGWVLVSKAAVKAPPPLTEFRL